MLLRFRIALPNPLNISLSFSSLIIPIPSMATSSAKSIFTPVRVSLSDTKNSLLYSRSSLFLPSLHHSVSLSTTSRSNTLQAIKTNQALPFLLRQPPKQFSTEPENPPQKTDLADPENQKNRYPDSAIDPILQSSSNEAIYGKLTGIGKHTLKTDIVDMLEGCALSPMDIRVDYNRYFNPQGMVLQFQSRTAFDTAIRLIRGKGQMFRLEKVDRSMWEITTYEGKTVLLQGIPRQAQPDDVEHFLCGCDFNPSNMRLFMRQAYPDPIRMGLIQFRTQIEAMRAVMMKNRSFCLNSQILMRVLQ